MEENIRSNVRRYQNFIKKPDPPPEINPVVPLPRKKKIDIFKKLWKDAEERHKKLHTLENEKFAFLQKER